MQTRQRAASSCSIPSMAASHATLPITRMTKAMLDPALTSVGNRLTPAWMYKWLKDPDALRPAKIMPNFSLKDDEARDLTAFLMTLKAKQGGGK